MEIEKQVVSLELAKKLKELGVKQDSSWYWTKNVNALEWGQALIKYRDKAVDGALPKGITDKLGKWCLKLKDTEACEDRGWGFYSAFTVAELGEMLPRGTKSFRDTADFKKDIYVCDRIGGNTEYADTEADARAKMLNYLIENKLIVV